MTVEAGMQELFDRVLRLEAERMAHSGVIGALVAIVASMPNGTGIDFMNDALVKMKDSAKGMLFQDTEGGKKVAEIYKDTIEGLMLKTFDKRDKRSAFTVIYGDKE